MLLIETKVIEKGGTRVYFSSIVSAKQECFLLKSSRSFKEKEPDVGANVNSLCEVRRLRRGSAGLASSSVSVVSARLLLLLLTPAISPGREEPQATFRSPLIFPMRSPAREWRKQTCVSPGGGAGAGRGFTGLFSASVQLVGTGAKRQS